MWKKYVIDENKVYFWKLGESEFWIKKKYKEWQIATKTNTEQANEIVIAAEVNAPVEVDWKSFIADKNNTLNIVPALPNLPVVVRPQNSFKLLPNMNVQLYVHIPVWIQLYAGTVKRENLIHEFPSQELSNTWFGDPDNGVLSYSLNNLVHISIEKEILLRNNEVLCPVRIANEASLPLDFQRLSLLSEFLNIYTKNNLLYASEIKVKFKGENIVSDINYLQNAPTFIENSKHLALPRNPEKSSVLKKSFHFIKSLTDY